MTNIHFFKLSLLFSINFAGNLPVENVIFIATFENWNKYVICNQITE